MQSADVGQNNRVIYSCIIGGYDVAFPPLAADPDIDYVLITDDPNLRVKGWTIKHVARAPELSAAAQNRWYKAFPHKVFPQHRSSIYIDGNLRPVKSLKKYLEQVERNPCDIMLSSHAGRSFVHEEIEVCIAKGKVADPDLIRREYEALQADGFIDYGRLTTNNVMVRDHTSVPLQAAMDMWWHYISNFAGRDQISLPHVLNKAGVQRAHLPKLLAAPHKALQAYPHMRKSETGFSTIRARAKARAPEGIAHMLLHQGLATLDEARQRLKR